ncbi:MAG: hypothetical protein ACRCTR_07255 [Actinomycetota bacterium]
MSVIYNLVVVAHLLGMAAIVGGWFTVLNRPRVLPTQLWGARAQVVTGLVLVGLAEMELGTEGEVNHARVAVKFLLSLVIAGAAESLVKRGRDMPGGDPRAHLVGGVALLTTIVAALWS